MKCDELLRLINDYVDGDIDPAMCDDFAGHLRDCNPCQIVVDNIRNTIRIYKNDEVFEVPLRFRRRLHERLRERWCELHPDVTVRPDDAP